MVKRVQLVRHDTAGSAAFTGREGEITGETTKKTLVFHDSVTPGGTRLAREDLDNVSVATESNAGKMSASQVTSLLTVIAGLAQELINRAAADTTLQSNIDSEASTRASDDATLQLQITSNDADIAQNISDIAQNASDIASEASTRAAADSALDSGKQNVSSELTLLAALSSTSFGRSLLELANLAAAKTALEIKTLGTFVNHTSTPLLSSTAFTLSGLTDSNYDTVGPTGGGATHTWSAMDALNGDEDYVDVMILQYLTVGSLTPDTVSAFKVYAHPSATTAIALNDTNLIFYADGQANLNGNARISGRQTARIPVDGSGHIHLTYDDTNYTEAGTAVMYLIGGGYNQ